MDVANIFYLYYSVFFISACEYEWGEYGECSETCGRGIKTRHPIIIEPAQHGGFCPGPEEVECEGDMCRE